MHNFLRVVRIYNLPKDQVAQGTIFDVSSKTPLSTKELRYILLKSHELGSYEDVASWSKFLVDQDYEDLRAEASILHRLHYNALFKVIMRNKFTCCFTHKLKKYRISGREA